MNSNVVKRALCLLLVAAATLPVANAAGSDVSTSAGINPMTPLINQVVLTDTDNNPVSAIDVNREYYLTIHILEKNGMDDITSISASVMYAGEGSYMPQSIDKRCMYNFIWTNNATQCWESVPSGYLFTDSCLAVEETPYMSAITFAFRFDKVAMPSGPINTWAVEVDVEDRIGLTSDFDSFFFDVNDYVEMGGLPSALNLSSANMDPEEAWILQSPLDVGATITSNTEVTIYFYAQDLCLDNISIDAGSFFSVDVSNCIAGGLINSQYVGGNPVPEESTPLYTDAFDFSCSLDPSVEGYSDNCTTLLDVTIDVLEGKNVPNIPAGEYTGTWTFSIERGTGTTQ